MASSVPVMIGVFSLAIFAGAGLVFLVQPMVAKMVLPLLGGSPAVWNTAMLFFQGLLLAGYAFAHLVTGRLSRSRQRAVYGLVLLAPLAFLPLGLPAWQPPGQGGYALWLLALLAVTAGIPYFVVTTASPLLQRWFSLTGHERADDPYFLYAAGNAGSLLALLAYPLVVEPTLTIPQQTWLWTGLYVVFVLSAGGCAWLLWRRPQASTDSARATSMRTATRTPVGAAVTDHGGLVAGPVATSGAAGPPMDADPDGGSGGPAATDETDNPHGGQRPPRPESGPRAAAAARRAQAPGLFQRARWVLLAFIPSSLMLGVTTYLTTDIAAVPLLWVIPLAIYLATFILAFSGWRWVRWAWLARLLPLLVVVVALELREIIVLPVWAQFALHLTTLLAAGMVAHGRLADERPAPAHLTGFFLLVSVGGVLGGVFNALVAPIAFDVLAEYAIALVLALAVRPAAGRVSLLPERFHLIEDLLVGAGLLYLFLGYLGDYPSGVQLLAALGLLALFVWHLSARVVEFAVVAAVVLAVAFLDVGQSMFFQRTFFGLVDVYQSTDGYHVLAHGTTVHGYQYWQPEPDPAPLSYHHRDGPIGDVFATYDDRPIMDETAVVGLGIGALAAYGEAGERMVFYEIDPTVVDIATNPKFFTYLPDAEADIDVVVGDGRLQIAEADDSRFGLVVLDAFSSDAVPVHLLTREAVATYLDKTAPGGLVAFNISNRYVDLRPVLAGIADELELSAVVRHDVEDEQAGESTSTWVVLARQQSDLQPLLEGDDGWSRLRAGPEAVVWTDHYSNLVRVLDWG